LRGGSSIIGSTSATAASTHDIFRLNVECGIALNKRRLLRRAGGRLSTEPWTVVFPSFSSSSPSSSPSELSTRCQIAVCISIYQVKIAWD